MLSLAGKTVLIFGCGSREEGWGIGRTISVLFARQGADIFGLDLQLETAERTRELILAEGGECTVGACNVTDLAQVEKAVQACLDRYGKIDILVNNVGMSEPGGPVEMAPETWASQLEVNVTSAFTACKAVLPHMVARGQGAVVNVSSIAGLRYIGKPQVAYSAAKAALMQFTRTTAVIHAASGVRLNCVVPGLMHTPLVRRLADKYAGGDYEGFVAKRNAQAPMGRMGDSWDVAHAALFLASDEARYITATEIVVDGGITASTG